MERYNNSNVLMQQFSGQNWMLCASNSVRTLTMNPVECFASSLKGSIPLFCRCTVFVMLSCLLFVAGSSLD